MKYLNKTTASASIGLLGVMLILSANPNISMAVDQDKNAQISLNIMDSVKKSTPKVLNKTGQKAKDSLMNSDSTDDATANDSSINESSTDNSNSEEMTDEQDTTIKGNDLPRTIVPNIPNNKSESESVKDSTEVPAPVDSEVDKSDLMTTPDPELEESAKPDLVTTPMPEESTTPPAVESKSAAPLNMSAPADIKN